MMDYRGLLMALGVACLTAAGCVRLGPAADPSRFFSLAPIAEAETAIDHSRQAGAALLGIGPLKLPAYLDREELVARVTQNRLTVSENDRWIEPLEENFSRILAQNLSLLVASGRVFRYPWQRSEKPGYRLDVEVFRFEPNSAEDAQLAARWAITGSADKEPLIVKESRLTRRAQGGSTEAAVAALSAALGDLSREIAAALRTLPLQSGAAEK